MNFVASRLSLLGMTAVLAVFVIGGAVAIAGHGPTRGGTDTCNGTDAFDINNMITSEIVDSVAAQNPDAVNADGTLDRTQITHAHLLASGHVALQFREKPGFPLSRLAFEFTATDSSWSLDSTNHPGYLTAAEAFEDPDQDAEGDSFVGETFFFAIPTDVVPDGNYVARIRAFDPDGGEAGRLCIDATVSNGQGAAGAAQANSDPDYEPVESTEPGFGFVPQPVAWFPAAEPTAAQQAGYGAPELRLEFLEDLESVRVEREEELPDGTATIWVDYSDRLVADDFSRPHSVSGSRSVGTPFEALANRKVWGPGYRFDFTGLAGEALPSERLRVSAEDAVGKAFCGIYEFSGGPNGSFLTSAPSSC